MHASAVEEHGMRTLRSVLGIAAIPLLSSTALAQPPAEPVPETPEPPPEAIPLYDWNVSAGLGLQSFSGSRANNAADIGAAWDVRLGLGTRYLVGGEVAYIGSTQSITALGIDSDAAVRSHGIEALARLNLDQIVGTNLGPVRVTPFVFAGVAYQRFHLANEGFNTSDVANSDNVFAIPLGVGGAGLIGRWLIDARFTYRPTFDEDLFRLPTGDRDPDASMSHWTLGARAGVSF
jgi:opacity protein-like surface antigen